MLLCVYTHTHIYLFNVATRYSQVLLGMFLCSLGAPYLEVFLLGLAEDGSQLKSSSGDKRGQGEDAHTLVTKTSFSPRTP